MIGFRPKHGVEYASCGSTILTQPGHDDGGAAVAAPCQVILPAPAPASLLAGHPPARHCLLCAAPNVAVPDVDAISHSCGRCPHWRRLPPPPAVAVTGRRRPSPLPPLAAAAAGRRWRWPPLALAAVDAGRM